MGGKTYFFFNDTSSEKTSVGLPDVYWDGKPEHGLADDPATGKPRVFSSKSEKSAYLKERGLVESGDRVGGAPSSYFSSEKVVDHRVSAMQALQHVKQMGKDVRRQEFLRIVKEGGRNQ